MRKVKRIIFLDVDGVLNDAETTETTPAGHTGVANKYLSRLSYLVSATQALLVLTSDWKYGWRKELGYLSADMKYLQEKNGRVPSGIGRHCLRCLPTLYRE